MNTMIDVSKFIRLIDKWHVYHCRIVRNRTNHHPSPPLPSTTTEEIHRTPQSTDAYSIHSLLHHPHYEYSTLKQRSSTIRLNGITLFSVIVYFDMPLVFDRSLTRIEGNKDCIWYVILDLAELTREQREFLEKFFKENPWMENVSIDIIGKQTGFPESMIKVRSMISHSLLIVLL